MRNLSHRCVHGHGHGVKGKLLLAGLPLLADEADGFQLIDATFGDAEGKNYRPRRNEPAKNGGSTVMDGPLV